MPSKTSTPAASAPGTRPRIAVLISGRGSNLQSIVDATRSGALDATVAVVISNRADAAGLTRARDAQIEAIHIDPRGYADRDAYDRALADALTARSVSVVCLAGFMRLVGRPLLDAFPNRILNIHPSLLPSFPGLDAQKQAIEHGVQVSGATVHIVNANLDGGPIVIQRAVPVWPDDTVETLAARILVEEHRIYPLAIAELLADGWRLEGRRFIGATPAAGDGRQAPPTGSRPPLDAIVRAIPFAPDEPIRMVELRAGNGELTDRLRRQFHRAHIQTFPETFDVASLSWWDAMFGADLVIAPFVMPKLTDAKKQYFFKAAADRVSARGGLLVIDAVDQAGNQLLHHLIWLRHAGFTEVDCRWLVEGTAIFGGFRPRAAAASAPPPPAGN